MNLFQLLIQTELMEESLWFLFHTNWSNLLKDPTYQTMSLTAKIYKGRNLTGYRNNLALWFRKRMKSFKA